MFLCRIMHLDAAGDLVKTESLHAFDSAAAAYAAGLAECGPLAIIEGNPLEGVSLSGISVELLVDQTDGMLEPILAAIRDDTQKCVVALSGGPLHLSQVPALYARMPQGLSDLAEALELYGVRAPDLWEPEVRVVGPAKVLDDFKRAHTERYH